MTWQTKKLSEICDYISRGISPKYVAQGGIVVLNQKCIRNHTVSYKEAKMNGGKIAQDKFIQIGDALVNSTGVGTLGRVAQAKSIKEKTTVDSHITIVRPNKNFFKTDFFGWLMIHIEGKLKEMGAGASGQIELSRITLKEINISYPESFSEQTRIVKILDDTFSKIDQAKTNTKKNLQNSKELLDSYLENVFVKQGSDWGTDKLENIFQIKPPKKEAQVKLVKNELVSFVPMADLKNDSKEFIVNQERKLREVSGSYTYFANEDVLLAKITPCFENGKLGIARHLKNEIGFGSSEYIVFRSKGWVIPDYLYYFLSRKQFRSEGQKRMTGASGHLRVSKEFIETYTMPFPKSLSEQKSIVNKLDQLSAQTKKLEAIYQKKLEDLEELKKSLLNKAFKGEL